MKKNQFLISRSWFVAFLGLVLILNSGCSQKVEGVTVDEAADFVMSVLEPKAVTKQTGRSGKEIANLRRGETEKGLGQIWFTDGVLKSNILAGPWMKVTFIPIDNGRSTKVMIRATSGLFLPKRDHEAERKWGGILTDASPVQPVQKIKKKR